MILTKQYWKEAFNNIKNTRYLCLAAIIVSLRVVVKLFRIQLAPGLELTFDCYINAIGSIIYGPVVGLLVGAVSDTVGAILFPSGIYFFPFIITEMLSSFIFGLCLYKKELTVSRIFTSRFLVSLICNIILTSVIMKWYYQVFDLGGYNIFNLARIVKNLVLFPIESVLLTLLITAISPIIKKKNDVSKLKLTKKHIILLSCYAVFAVALVVVYIVWLKPYVTGHNIKWL